MLLLLLFAVIKVLLNFVKEFIWYPAMLFHPGCFFLNFFEGGGEGPNTNIILKVHILQIGIQILFMTPCTKNMKTNMIYK